MQKDTRRQEPVTENKESCKGGRSPQLAVYFVSVYPLISHIYLHIYHIYVFFLFFENRKYAYFGFINILVFCLNIAC